MLDKHLQVRTSIAAESTTTLRKRKGGKHKTTPLCPDDEGDECGLPETPPEAVTVVIDMLPAHKAFVESFAEELEKANAWYASKLVELKVTIDERSTTTTHDRRREREKGRWESTTAQW